ncbi:MAG: hypothetical protein FWG31_10290 [Oscillospiraceae bacterium]|nr:hypothetical protein [Oscillospiraceae bacterium]
MASPSKGKNSQEKSHLDTAAFNVASATDFTGLIPANPQQPKDLYEDIYPTGIDPAKKKKKG